MENTEDRRNLNLHTFEELTVAGNHFVGGRPEGRSMTMRRGNTYTQYIREGKYWKPVHSYTQYRY